MDLTAEVNRAGDGRRVYDPVGDGIHQGIRGGHYDTPGTVASAVENSLGLSGRIINSPLAVRP